MLLLYKKLILTTLVLMATCVQAIDLNSFLRLQKERDRAIKRGDWPKAAVQSVKLSEGDDVCGRIPANSARELIIAALCQYNMKENVDACHTSLMACSWLGIVGKDTTNAGSRIKGLANAIKAGRMKGKKFTENDLLSNVGIVNYVMAPVYALTNEQHRKRMVQLNNLIGQISASTDVYRKEGDRTAAMAKFTAKQDFLEKHHKTFDPTERPSAESGLRDDWDSCKRICDIFGK